MQQSKPTGYVIYEGPSMLDGSPIVCIALTSKSTNAKTGAMMQTYIIRSDVSPIDAVRTGADAAICGDCFHRGDAAQGRKRSCYVTLMHGPRAVYAAYKAGKYPKAIDYAGHFFAGQKVQGEYALAFDRNVRLGTYGDPAAVPYAVWVKLLKCAKGWTGYTHQWDKSRELQGLVMASCDTAEEAQEAQAQGWRTFRVKTADAPMLPREVTCPASEEAGKRTDCNTCQACKGADGRKGTIVINVHGSLARNFAQSMHKSV